VTEAPLRVLVFAPVGRDGPLTRDLLARESIDASVCASMEATWTALGEGAGALILTEEALDDPDLPQLVAVLDQQPAWSDIPVILFAGSERATASLRTLHLLEILRNVTFMERPIRVAAVISVVRAALRARSRQYETRDILVALHATRAEAEAANRLKDEFLATLSHELRTPLNAILGWTTMLRHGQIEPGRVARALDVVERNARAQARLIEDVLDMARIVTGKLRLEMVPVALGPIVDAAIEAVRPTAEAKQIRLQVDPWGNLPLIRGDAARLQQILWNLVSNAVKFTPAGGEVRIRLGQVRSYVTIAVSDTGAGLAPEFLPFVFDRFRQADQSVTRGHGGLGLGLSIVKQLTELHGGWVTARSDGVGLGATFTVSLPAPGVASFSADQTSADRRQAEAFAIRLPERAILVVDDDEATRELLAELIGRTGATVDTVDSAAAAFEALRGRTYDAIVADIGMPGEDGHSLMRRIRGLRDGSRLMPAIALSAYTRAEDREAARRAGFTEFLAKPATPEELLHALDELIGTHDR
jgi:signal transduction histidine kinase/CheY-like chemotaxis protein